jgi:hypothetical protein
MRGAPEIAIAETNAAAIARRRLDGYSCLAACAGRGVGSVELLVQVMLIAPRLCRGVFSLSTPESVDVQRRAAAFARFGGRLDAAYGTRFDGFETRVAFTNTARGLADSAKSRRQHGIFTIAIAAIRSSRRKVRPLRHGLNFLFRLAERRDRVRIGKRECVSSFFQQS